MSSAVEEFEGFRGLENSPLKNNFKEDSHNKGFSKSKLFNDEVATLFCDECEYV